MDLVCFQKFGLQNAGICDDSIVLKIAEGIRVITESNLSLIKLIQTFCCKLIRVVDVFCNC